MIYFDKTFRKTLSLGYLTSYHWLNWSLNLQEHFLISQTVILYIVGV